MLSIICSKCSVFLILAFMLLVKGAQIFSMNLDNFPIAVLQPVANSLIGIPSLCVLYNVEFFPDRASSFVLVIACLGGRFGINYPSAFLKMWVISKFSKITRAIYPQPNMWLLVNHTKPTNTLY